MDVVKAEFEKHAVSTDVQAGARACAAELAKLLSDSEARFRSLTTLSTDAYWEQDDSYRFTVLTGAHLEPAGFDSKQVLGTTLWDGAAVPAGDGATWASHQATLQARQPFADFVLKSVNSRGELRYVSCRGEPVFDAQRRFTGYRGTAKDVTRPVRMELRLSIEHAVTRALAEAIGIDEAAPKIIQVICETLGWSCGARWEVHAGNPVPSCAQTWGVASAEIDAFLEATRQHARVLRQRTQPAQFGGLVRRAWLESKPHWISDVTQEATFRRRPDALKAGLHSAFAFPILLEGRAIGVMEFFSREIHQPDPELLDCMSYVGSQLGQFMQRKRAEEAQRRFRAAIDVSADLVLLIDPRSLLCVDANETACRVLGYGREELLALGAHDIFGASREALVRQFECLIAGELSPATTQDSCRRKEGSQLAVESTSRAVPSATGHVIVTVARDITARKRNEQLVRLEHTVARCLSEADCVPSALKSVIRSICEAHGWDCGRYFHADEKTELLRFTAASGVSEELVSHLIENSRGASYTSGTGLIGSVWQSGQPIWSSDIAKDERLRKGIARELGMHGSFVFPVLSEKKTVGVLIFHSRDIREPEAQLLQSIGVIGNQIGQFVQRKQAEEVLRESVERLRSLSKLSSDWFWEQDTQLRFTRIEGRHVAGDGAAFQGDLGKTFEDTGAEIDGGGAAHRELLDAHLPFRDVVMWRTQPDGQRRCMSIGGEPMFDTERRFLGYRGVGADITERKRAEQLRALEHAVNRSLNEAQSVQDALKRVLRNVCETLGWECGRYLRVDAPAGVVRFGEAWSIPSANIERYLEASRSMVYGPGIGVVGRVWQSGEPLWIADIGQDARVARPTLARETGLRGTLAVAVTSEGETIGVLIFHCGEQREPDERLLQAIGVSGSQLGQFLQRKNSEQATLRLSRMFAALSETNDAILHAQSPDDLYQRVCQAAVHGGRFSNTSIFLADQSASELSAVSGAGRAAHLLRGLRISLDETLPQGRGLASLAFRNRQPSVSNDYLQDDRTAPWHALARQSGWRAAAASRSCAAGWPSAPW